MSQFPKQAVGRFFVVALMLSLTNAACAQSLDEDDDDAVSEILEFFKKEREKANWPYDNLVKHADTIVTL